MIDCPPRVATARTNRRSLGPSVAKVAAALGQPLMPWQQLVADVALEVDDETGRLAYREVVLTVPRQQGKSSLLLAIRVHRAVHPFFGTPQSILWTAQSRVAARTKWSDVQVPLLERSPFSGRFDVRRSTGQEALQWRNGSIDAICAAGETSGHGETLDLGLVDEAWSQRDNRLEQAFRPAMLTRPQPQLWLVSTAGDLDSVYFRAKVDAGREAVERGDTTGVAFFEWSALPDADPGSSTTWRSCMPALGTTVTLEAVASDFAAMASDEFRRSHLNLWIEARGEPLFPTEAWERLGTRSGPLASPSSVAVDVPPERASASIVAARVDGDRVDIDVIAAEAGTGWVVARLTGLGIKHVLVEGAGPAAALIGPIERAGIEVKVVSGRESQQAAGGFFDAVVESRLAHGRHPALDAAIAGATRRPVGDAWSWSRRSSAVDISPLCAASIATWAASQAVTPVVAAGFKDLNDYLDD